MYRKATVILLMALALTLTVGTVAIGAPKDKRVVCQDGVTKEIPAHAKAKGATEGPCEEAPDSDAALAEELCRTLYGGKIVDSALNCQFSEIHTMHYQRDSVTYLSGTWVIEVSWEEDEEDRYAYDTHVFAVYPTECVDMSTGTPQPLALDDPRCDPSQQIF